MAGPSGGPGVADDSTHGVREECSSADATAVAAVVVDATSKDTTDEAPAPASTTAVVVVDSHVGDVAAPDAGVAAATAVPAMDAMDVVRDSVVPATEGAATTTPTSANGSDGIATDAMTSVDCVSTSASAPATTESAGQSGGDVVVVVAAPSCPSSPVAALPCAVTASAVTAIAVGHATGPTNVPGSDSPAVPPCPKAHSVSLETVLTPSPSVGGGSTGTHTKRGVLKRSCSTAAADAEAVIDGATGDHKRVRHIPASPCPTA